MIKTLDYNGAVLHYKDEGKGTVVVLLHGYLESMYVWDEFSTELSKNYRVFSIDLPGHGQSEPFKDEITMEDMAAAVHFVLQQNQVEHAVIVGHSMGGYVSLAYAQKYWSMVEGLCLFHSTPFADTREKKENRQREIELVKQGKKDAVLSTNIPKMYSNDNLDKMCKELEISKNIAFKTSEKGIIAALRGMMARVDRSEFLENLDIPFLLILGKKDNYIPYDGILEKIKLPDNAKVVTLENSGHMGFIEEKEKSLKAIRDFVNRV
jgi:pimeloyl-ACP methyl ester carboxylesterase